MENIEYEGMDNEYMEGENTGHTADETAKSVTIQEAVKPELLPQRKNKIKKDYVVSLFKNVFTKPGKLTTRINPF